MSIKFAFLIFLQLFLNCTITYGVETNFKDHIIIAGKWGSGDGEFGKEEMGKTELGYALDFKVYLNRIYILDTINNRIQVFDLDGKFLEKIPLDFNWIEQGIAWEFSLLRNNYFLLVAKPPHYSTLGVNDIYKFASNGKLLKKFGSKQINKSKEEYFYNVRSSEKRNNIFCGIGGTAKIAVYDFDGNFIKYLMNATTNSNFIIDDSGEVVNVAQHHFSWIDKKGNLYRVKSISSRKNNFEITTNVQIYNPRKNAEINYEIAGDVKLAKNDEVNIIKYAGNFTEASFVDFDGVIYHLIALSDGVVLRRIELN